MNWSVLEDRIGRILGIVGAKAIPLAGEFSLATGWLAVTFFIGITITTLIAGSGGSWLELKGVAIGVALVAAGFEAAGHEKSLYRFGLLFGFTVACLFVLFVPLSLIIGEPLLAMGYFVGALASLSLSAFAANRYPDQVATIFRRTRAYLYGVRADGRAWNWFGCLMAPGLPAAGFFLSVYVLFHRRLAGSAVSSALQLHEVAWVRRSLLPLVVPHSLAVPGWVSSTWLWLFFSACFAVAFYVGCRRVGCGEAKRGLRLFVLSLMQIVAAAGIFFTIPRAVHASSLAGQVAWLAASLVIAALVCGAHFRRRLIINIYGHHDRQWGQ